MKKVLFRIAAFVVAVAVAVGIAYKLVGPNHEFFVVMCFVIAMATVVFVLCVAQGVIDMYPEYFTSSKFRRRVQ
jgi:hypothetical protein